MLLIILLMLSEKNIIVLVLAISAVGVAYYMYQRKNNKEQMIGSACRPSSIQKEYAHETGQKLINPMPYTAIEGGKNPNHTIEPMSDFSKKTDSEFKNIGMFNGSFPMFGAMETQLDPGHVARIAKADLDLPYIQKSMYRPNKQRLDARVISTPISNDIFFSGPDEVFGNLGLNSNELKQDMQQMCTKRALVHYPTADEYVMYGDNKPKFCRDRLKEKPMNVPLGAQGLQYIGPSNLNGNNETIMGMNKWQFSDTDFRDFERNTLEKNNLAIFSMTSNNNDVVSDRQLVPLHKYGITTNSKFQECLLQLPHLGVEGCAIASTEINRAFY